MKKFVTRAIIIALIGSTGILSGCYGPFRLTTKLHQWNGNVSNKKFVNELVFLGLCILPAYGLCTLGDVLIFNSIEFWGGQNPITMKDGQIDESEFMHEGKMYKVIKSKNNMTYRCESGFPIFPGRKYLVPDERKRKSSGSEIER